MTLILAVDVYYRDGGAVAAGVMFDDWSADSIEACYLSAIAQVSPYRPGRFYQRELPCSLTLLSEHKLVPDTIIIDGYVYLDGVSIPGLGRYLYDALQGRVVIIGVAKKPFIGIAARHRVLRGSSHNPLYITAAGMQLAVAKKLIRSMHGKYRIPTLLKLADQSSRGKCRGEYNRYD